MLCVWRKIESWFPLQNSKFSILWNDFFSDLNSLTFLTDAYGMGGWFPCAYCRWSGPRVCYGGLFQLVRLTPLILDYKWNYMKTNYLVIRILTCAFSLQYWIGLGFWVQWLPIWQINLGMFLAKNSWLTRR